MELELLFLCATLGIVLLWLWASGRAGTGRTMPPGPRPLPVVGNLLSLGSILHHTLARLALIHGPVMTLKLGLTTAVVISSRDTAAEAFTKHDRSLAARSVPDTGRVLGFSDRSILWLPSSDPLWKSLRRIVATNVFSSSSLTATRAVRERKVRDLVSYFRGSAGREVDIGEAVYGGAINLISSSFCSVDVVDVGGESAQGLRELVEDLIAALAAPNVSDIFPFLQPLDLQGWRRWTAIRQEKVYLILDGIIDGRMAAANSSTEKHGDFLDTLLEHVSTGKIAGGSVTTILFEVLAAGSNTVALSVEWAMAELLRNPGVMAKVRAEIGNALGGKETVNEADAASLPYLQAVVKEAMRLHPVGPLLMPHKAVEEGVEIGGYSVPKGSTVIFNAWAIMRDPAAWERPDEFVPERFLDMPEQMDFRGKAYEFIPFGSGRRLCPGMPLAERVVPFILASLLHAFEWQLPDGVSAEELDVSERFTTANVMAVPLKAVPVVVA